MSPISNMTVERAIPDDAYSIQEVIYLGWLDAYPNVDYGVTVGDIEAGFVDRVSDAKLSNWRSEIADMKSNNATFVARVGGQVVGVARATRGAESGFLKALYVLPDFKRKGVGSELLRAIREYIGYSNPLSTTVVVYNAAAIRFYGSHGFKDTGERLSTFTMIESGVKLEEIVMHLGGTPLGK